MLFLKYYYLSRVMLRSYIISKITKQDSQKLIWILASLR